MVQYVFIENMKVLQMFTCSATSIIKIKNSKAWKSYFEVTIIYSHTKYPQSVRDKRLLHDGIIKP